jgi:hypothetical protein
VVKIQKCPSNREGTNPYTAENVSKNDR